MTTTFFPGSKICVFRFLSACIQHGWRTSDCGWYLGMYRYFRICYGRRTDLHDGWDSRCYETGRLKRKHFLFDSNITEPEPFESENDLKKPDRTGWRRHQFSYYLPLPERETVSESSTGNSYFYGWMCKISRWKRGFQCAGIVADLQRWKCGCAMGTSNPVVTAFSPAI